MLPFAFSRAELWVFFIRYKLKLSYVLKSKRIDFKSKIKSKRYGVFTKNFNIFFSNAGKTRNVPGFELDKF